MHNLCLLFTLHNEPTSAKPNQYKGYFKVCPTLGSDKEADNGSGNKADNGSDKETDNGSDNVAHKGSNNGSDNGSDNKADNGSGKESDNGSDNRANGSKEEVDGGGSNTGQVNKACLFAITSKLCSVSSPTYFISSDRSSYSDVALLETVQFSQIFTQSIDAIDVTSVTLSCLNSINAIDVTRC